MFERGPFKKCFACGRPSFGILSAGGTTLRRRCTACRYVCEETLPPVDKKVVYLDQLAISEIYKLKSGKRNVAAGGQALWEEIAAQVNRTFLLQQVIFPGSNIHRDETIVSPFRSELALAHEMLSGDISLANIEDVELSQTFAHASAYSAGSAEPAILFGVDEILEGGERNEWIRDLHISANMDYGIFAEGIRKHREEADASCTPLWERWIAQKPSFTDVLMHELNDFSKAKRGALRHAAKRAQEALEIDHDTQEFLDRLSHPTMREFNQLKEFFRQKDQTDREAAGAVYNFWDWPVNREMPVHRISAYLFAGIARRLASGQKRHPSRGMMNDIRAISTYGPYVDAMFLDNECASLLSEEPLRTELRLKAKVFSAKSGEAFLQYLRDLEAAASAEVTRYAEEIYGL